MSVGEIKVILKGERKETRQCKWNEFDDIRKAEKSQVTQNNISYYLQWDNGPWVTFFTTMC